MACRSSSIIFGKVNLKNNAGANVMQIHTCFKVLFSMKGSPFLFEFQLSCKILQSTHIRSKKSDVLLEHVMSAILCFTKCAHGRLFLWDNRNYLIVCFLDFMLIERGGDGAFII